MSIMFLLQMGIYHDISTNQLRQQKDMQGVQDWPWEMFFFAMGRVLAARSEKYATYGWSSLKHDAMYRSYPPIPPKW